MKELVKFIIHNKETLTRESGEMEFIMDKGQKLTMEVLLNMKVINKYLYKNFNRNFFGRGKIRKRKIF